MKEISVEKLKLNKDRYLIIDVREDNEREESGYIRESHHIPFSKINADSNILKNFIKNI